MTYLEAIEALKPITENDAYEDKFRDACELAIKAMELQIAKKPINLESVPYSSDDDWITYGICLNCGHIVDTKEDKERCLSCGQKLLWE